MDTVVESLEKFGFSTYEARAYLALLQDNPTSGYQLSKLCGIPRSRIYEVLDRLVSKGYVYILHGDPAQYAPLERQELLSRLKGEFADTYARLEGQINQIPASTVPEKIWTLQGRQAIFERARTMIESARRLAYIVGWAQTLEQLQPEIMSAASKGIKTVVISCGDLDLDIPSHYCHAFEEDIVRASEGSLTLVMDGLEVLVGETLPPKTCQAAWSRNQGLVFVAEEYIRHEVYIHKIIQRLGEDRAEELR